MSLVRNAGVVAIGSLLKSLLGLMIGVVLARSLGPSGMGQIQLVITLTTVAATIAVLGIGKANIYALNSLEICKRTIVGNTLAASFILATLVFIFVVSILVYGGKYFGEHTFPVIMMVAIATASMLVQAMLRPILLALMKIRAYTVSIVVIQTTYLLILLVLVLVGLVSIDMAIIAFTSAQIVGVLAVIWPLVVLIRCARVSVAKFMITLKYGLTLHATNVLLLLDQQIVFLMFALLVPGNFVEIGIYSRGLAVVGLLRILLGAFFDLMYSHWAKMETKSSVRQAEQMSRLLFPVGFIMAFIIILFSSDIIIILYGEEFLPSVRPLQILAVQQLCWLMSKVLQALFAANGKAKFSYQGLLLSVSLNSLGMLLLIPMAGALGAAIAITVAQLVYLGANIIHAKRLGLSLKRCIVPNQHDIVFVILQLDKIRSGKKNDARGLNSNV